MKLIRKKKSIYQFFKVDAFVCKNSTRGTGSPTPIVFLDEFLSDEQLLKISTENNCGETTFLVHHRNNEYYVREVELCGHGTVAGGHVFFNELKLPYDEIILHSKFSGEVRLYRDETNESVKVSLPTQKFEDNVNEEVKSVFRKSFRKEYKNRSIKAEVTGDLYWLIELDSKKSVSTCSPDFKELIKIGRGVIITSQDFEDEDIDIVSRFFGPWYGVNEDIVTGSAHSLLSSYWYERLGRNQKVFRCKQLSERTGEILVEYSEKRTFLTGKSQTFLVGKILVYLTNNL